MRQNALFLILMLTLMATFCFANASHYAIANGNWNANATWSNTSGGGAGTAFPVAGDAVYIAEATSGTTLITVTIPTGVTAECASLTFGPSGTTGPRPGTLAFASATSILNVSANVIMYRPSSNSATKTITIGAGQMNVTGNLSMAVSGATSGTTRVSAITISTGTLTIGGNLAYGTVDASNSTITFSGAGTMNIGGNFTGTMGTLTPGTASTVNFNGAGAQAVPIGVSSITYFNLNFAGAGTKTISAAISATNVTGNINVNGGTLANGGFAIVGNASRTFAVANGATFSLTGTSTMPTVFGTRTFGATSTVNYAGAAQSVTAVNYGHLTFSATGNKTAAAGLTVAGNFTLTAGTFIAGTYTHNIAGNFSRAGTFTQGTSTMNFNGTAAQSIGGTATTFNLVTINNAVGVTLNVATTATTVTVASGSILDKGAYAITGALTNNGTVKSSVATLASGTVTHGTNSTIDYTAPINLAGLLFKNLTLSATGHYYMTGALTAANVLTLSNVGTYLHTANFALSYGSLAGLGSVLVEAKPAIDTPTSASVTANSAVLGGNITSINNADVTERGIFYSLNDGFADGAGSKVSEIGTYGTGVFTVNVGSLTESTTYYYKAFATNTYGTAYTAQGSFITPSAYDVPAGVPTDIGGGITLLTTVDLNNGPAVPDTDPVFLLLPNMDNVTNPVILSYSGVGVGNLTVTVGIGTWYGLVYYGGMWHIADLPLPLPLVVGSGTGNLVFNNVDFGVKGDVVVLLTEGTDPTLPIELSSFTAVLTSQYFISLTWVTESEAQVLGFNVYRSDSNSFADAVRLNPVIIPATNTSQQQTYTMTDTENLVTNQTYYYWLESVDIGGGQPSLHGPISALVTGQPTPTLPEISMMKSAYPNPFSVGAATSIDVSIKAGETGTVTIYNILGQTVKTYNVKEGDHKLTWNAKGCASGIYFYKLSTPSRNTTKKLVIVN